MEDISEKVFTTTAVFSEANGGHYKHFGIHPITASVFGDKIEDIKKIQFKIAKDQTLPKSNVKNDVADYWGWYEFKDNTFGMMIYPQRFLLDMCFPSGIKGYEDAGEGKAYRLEIL